MSNGLKTKVKEGDMIPDDLVDKEKENGNLVDTEMKERKNPIGKDIYSQRKEKKRKYDPEGEYEIEKL